MNVPRSVAKLIADLNAAGYRLDALSEQQLIDHFGTLLRPFYRPQALGELMQSEDWAFLPLADYQRWFGTLPEAVRAEIEQFWGPAEQSGWVAEHDGVRGFVIPRIAARNNFV